jgi:hypothetical protein
MNPSATEHIPEGLPKSLLSAADSRSWPPADWPGAKAISEQRKGVHGVSNFVMFY